jgi:ADP-ribosyl-[dinitrogen reductase] hydrolase
VGMHARRSQSFSVEPAQFEERPDADTRGSGGGYVVDCLRSARDVCQSESSYRDVVKAAIALGHDTDTTAAVAGGIAGILYGASGIPEDWLAALRGRDVADALIERWLDATAVK